MCKEKPLVLHGVDAMHKLDWLLHMLGCLVELTGLCWLFRRVVLQAAKFAQRSCCSTHIFALFLPSVHLQDRLDHAELALSIATSRWGTGVPSTTVATSLSGLVK